MNERCEEKERRERRKMKENGEATGADDVRCAQRVASSRQRAEELLAVQSGEWRVSALQHCALSLPLTAAPGAANPASPAAFTHHTSHMTLI